MPETIRFNRCSAAQFRTSVPTQVNGRLVLEVVGFRVGGSGYYASAFALSTDNTAGRSDSFSTHQLICRDDSPVGELNWILESGHYFDTHERAFIDLFSRAMSRYC